MPGEAGRSVGVAVEEALLPLRLQRISLCPDGTSMPLQQVDEALAPLHLQEGYSRTALRRYLRANVFLCLLDGTFYQTQKELVQHLRKGAKLPRGTVKQYNYAKLLLVKYQG